MILLIPIDVYNIHLPSKTIARISAWVISDALRVTALINIVERKNNYIPLRMTNRYDFFRNYDITY